MAKHKLKLTAENKNTRRNGKGVEILLINNGFVYQKNIFNEIKYIPLISIIERYSPSPIIKKRKYGLLLCPFHKDSHPSLSFKGQRWRCWSCGSNGDGINFVAQLYRLRPIDAARLIASDFGIGIDLNNPLTDKQKKEIQKQQKINKLKKAWNKGLDILFRMAAELRDFLLEVDNPDEIDGETLKTIFQLENLMDVLMVGDFESIMTILNGGDIIVILN